MSSQTPEGPISEGLARLAAMQAAQRKVAEELAAERDAQAAAAAPVVPAAESAPEQKGG